jgi:hypothetical protein
MNKREKIVLAITIVGIYTFAMATATTGGGAIQQCGNMVAGTNQNVRGQDANCESSSVGGGGVAEEMKELFNSFKDRVSWDLKKAKFSTVNLGKISEDKDFTVEYPAVGSMKDITFMPTSSARKNVNNKTVHLLLVPFAIDKDNTITVPDAVQKEIDMLRKNKSPFKVMMKIYRKIGTERQWEERGQIYLNTLEISKVNLKLTIMPNGELKSTEKLYETGADGVTIEYPADTFDFTAI